MIIVDQNTLDVLVTESKSSPRQRKNKNYHAEDADPLQRMLNAFEPASYICPHKHQDPDKRELFVILTGRMLVLEFDEVGEITSHIILDHAAGVFSAEIAPRAYHACYALEPGTVVWEVKDGPYDVNVDKCFAPWAPKEGDEGTAEFVQSLFERVGLA